MGSATCAWASVWQGRQHAHTATPNSTATPSIACRSVIVSPRLPCLVRGRYPDYPPKSIALIGRCQWVAFHTAGPGGDARPIGGELGRQFLDRGPLGGVVPRQDHPDAGAASRQCVVEAQ